MPISHAYREGMSSFRTDYVDVTPASRRGSGRSRESEDDPVQTLGTAGSRRQLASIEAVTDLARLDRLRTGEGQTEEPAKGIANSCLPLLPS